MKRKIGTVKIAPPNLFPEALERFEEAAVALSWAGTQPPGDRAGLQERYDRLKAMLLEYVAAIKENADG